MKRVRFAGRHPRLREDPDDASGHDAETRINREVDIHDSGCQDLGLGDPPGSIRKRSIRRGYEDGIHGNQFWLSASGL